MPCWHRKTCSYLARAPPAGRHSELRLLVSLQSKQTGLRSTENREERGGRVLCKAHKKSKRCGRRPNHNLRPSVRSRFSARQINYKLAGKSEYSDWPFAGEKLKAWEERGHFMGPSHREHSSVIRIFIAPDCRSKS